VSGAESPARWLLLAHQLPARSSNARVKTWRRLQQVGAVPARNSVYVLPNTEQCREDFEWLRSEIVALGGEATVFAADTLDGAADEDLVRAFRQARDGDYDAIAREARALASPRGGKRGRRTGDPTAARAIGQLRERMTIVGRIDFFGAPRGAAAAAALEAVERRQRGRDTARKETSVRAAAAKAFTNRRWVTRPRPGVDRMASAWLIRRHIDPAATFGFVERPSESDVPFDMYSGDFSHRGTSCTFEVLAQQFRITNPAVHRIAEVVHDLDMKDNRYGAPEAAAVGRMIDGLRQLHADDAALLEQGMAMFEALARSFGSSAGRKLPRKRGTGRKA